MTTANANASHILNKLSSTHNVLFREFFFLLDGWMALKQLNLKPENYRPSD